MSAQQTQRKLVYYVATSIDHFIAREDGSFDDFLSEGHHITDYIDSLQQYDTVLMGKHTYEVAYQYGLKAGDPSPTYPHMMQYVFSQSMEVYNHPQLKVIKDDASQFVNNLKQEDGGTIYLCGGGKFAGYLLAHQLIDEIILKVNPIILGSGIPVFGAFNRVLNTELLDTKIYNNGVVFLHYALKK